MNRPMTQGILIGIVLGLLVGMALVAYFQGEWSWLIFGATLGAGMGIGIGLQLGPARRKR